MCAKLKPKFFAVVIRRRIIKSLGKRFMKNNLRLIILVIFLSVFGIRAQDISEEVRLKTFEKVWSTINDKHFDPDFGGVDWKKVGDEYKPKALEAKSGVEFYGVIQQMLGELNQSHFAIVPPNTQVSATSFGEGEIGIEIHLLENRAVIARVGAGSTGAKAGLKTGFVIEKIGGKTVAEILAPLNEKLAKRRDTEPKKLLYRERALMTAISGKIDSVVSLETSDAQDKTRVFEIERVAYTGEMSPPFGNFPAQQVIFESKILPENVGYIRFNVWVLPQMEKLQKAILSMKDARGIVFDLRGNPGGVGGMSNGIAGFLFDKESSLGTMRYRTGEMNFLIHPQKDAFLGKIAVLTDYATGSTSEVFAAGLQETGRAKIIGEQSAGAVLPSLFEKLPDGALFQYAVADYKSPRKILIEGRGVIPDKEVKLTRRSLLGGKDLQLETAIKEILKK